MDKNLRSLQVAKRIVEASGYLELGMPERALGVLDELNASGPFVGPVNYLRGQALRAQKRFAEAVAPLTTAASLFPAPIDRHVWMVLSQCCYRSGDLAQAVHSLAHARGAFVKPGPTPDNAPNEPGPN